LINFYFNYLEQISVYNLFKQLIKNTFIMELLSSLNSKKNYCGSIKTSNYTQQIHNRPKQKVYQNINYLFIDHFDVTCSILEEKEKEVYVKQRIVEIATAIDENANETYDIFKYSKQMKSSTIQIGLQSLNNLSSLLYLSDLYKVTSVIYIDSLKTKITTSKKTRNLLHILYKDGSFIVMDEANDYKEGDFKQLGECFVLNTKNLDIYVNHLQAISKYKSPELIDIAKGIGLPLEYNGKKKVKKQLYDDINLYYLNK
jgi:hypothetical protein